jgi:hypothetical protein
MLTRQPRICIEVLSSFQAEITTSTYQYTVLCFESKFRGVTEKTVNSKIAQSYITKLPITVAARSKAWTVFVRSNTGLVGSDPTRGMDVCLRLFYVYFVLCVGSGLVTGLSPVQGFLVRVYRLRNWKSAECPTKGCRAVDRYHKIPSTRLK